MIEELCDNCEFAENHKTVKHDHGQYVAVDCTAPVPGYISHLKDDRNIGVGHKAAKYCEAFKAKH